MKRTWYLLEINGKTFAAWRTEDLPDVMNEMMMFNNPLEMMKIPVPVQSKVADIAGNKRMELAFELQFFPYPADVLEVDKALVPCFAVLDPGSQVHQKLERAVEGLLKVST